MTLAEVAAGKPVKAQTPAQMRTATNKRAEALARVEDARKAAAIKIATARRKAAQT